MGAIESEAKAAASGRSDDRLWYINQDLLEKLGIKQWKGKEGDNFLRIVPPLDPNAYFALKIFVHYNVGPTGDAFLCPKMMKMVQQPVKPLKWCQWC